MTWKRKPSHFGSCSQPSLLDGCGRGQRTDEGETWHGTAAPSADAVLAIRKEKDAAGEIVALTVEMMKDGEAGEVIASCLRGVTVGTDEDNEPGSSSRPSAFDK